MPAYVIRSREVEQGQRIARTNGPYRADAEATLSLHSAAVLLSDMLDLSAAEVHVVYRGLQRVPHLVLCDQLLVAVLEIFAVL